MLLAYGHSIGVHGTIGTSVPPLPPPPRGITRGLPGSSATPSWPRVGGGVGALALFVLTVALNCASQARLIAHLPAAKTASTSPGGTHERCVAPEAVLLLLGAEAFHRRAYKLSASTIADVFIRGKTEDDDAAAAGSMNQPCDVPLYCCIEAAMADTMYPARQPAATGTPLRMKSFPPAA